MLFLAPPGGPGGGINTPRGGVNCSVSHQGENGPFFFYDNTDIPAPLLLLLPASRGAD